MIMDEYSVEMKFNVDVAAAFDELTGREQEAFIKERMHLISDTDVAEMIGERGIYDYLDDGLMKEQLEAWGYTVTKDE